MTIKELSQYYYLRREITGYREKIAGLEAKATDISAKITGMPHASATGDKIGRLATEAEYYRDILLKRMEYCNAELLKLTEYIAGCDDSLIRQILTYRFVECMSWGQVAVKVGGGNTADSCRKRAKRFLQRN